MARTWFGGFDPMVEMSRLRQEVDHLFHTHEWWPELRARLREYPAVSIHSAGTDLLIRAEMPGMKLEDIQLTITGDMMSIRGERKPEPGITDDDYQRRERGTGLFARTVQLPTRVVADKAEARYVNGVLSIRVPKAEEAQPKKIPVREG